MNLALPTVGFAPPPLKVVAGGYVLRFARTAADVEAVLRLRYEIFNIELNEGLDASHITGRDEDEFDPQCHHLMVVEQNSGKVIGTYRMQTREMALAGQGFYSESEFDLTGLSDAVLDNAVELGRACIDQSHRNMRVLLLLWRGLAAYVAHHHKRYLFGCCSLTSQDPAEGQRVMNYLEAHGHTHPTLCLQPQPDYACASDVQDTRAKLPRLMKIYLAYGAKICSQPAIDRHFKTIDYLALIDVQQLDPQTYRYFFG
jgi:putative hemolysin